MKAVRRKYNLLAHLYDWIWPHYIKKTIRMALAPLSPKNLTNILDIGCGTGELEKALLQKNPSLKITGIDLSEDMLEKAEKKLIGHKNIELKRGDFLNVALPEGDFDAAFSLSNLHYFPDPNAVFRKTNRLLKKGGKFVIVDWNRHSIRGKIYNGYMNLGDPSFVKIYTAPELTELLKTHSFEVKNIQYFKVAPFWNMMCLVSERT